MIPETNDIVHDSVPETKNTSFICGVVEGSYISRIRRIVCNLQ